MSFQPRPEYIISKTIYDYFHSIDHVSFSVMSPTYIRHISVCQITNIKLEGNESLYDKRMGAITPRSLCETCGMSSLLCTGHFGHIELNVYILHPLYISTIMQCLRCVCFECSQFVLREDDFCMFASKNPNSFSALMNIIKSFHYCMNCSAEQPRYMLVDRYIQMVSKNKEPLRLEEEDIYLRLKHFPDWVCRMCNISRPDYLVLTVLPVLPPISRPPVMADSSPCDDDLTLQYLEILKTSLLLSSKRGYVSADEWLELKGVLMFRIHSLMDNTSGKAKHTNQRAFKGIRERLAGKDGLLRNNLMGKRVDYSSRTVIGPDPTLQIDQVGLPHEMMENLIYREIVTDYNHQQLLEDCLSNRVVAVVHRSSRIHLKYALATEEKRKSFTLHTGDIVERRLRDGDLVLINRQPTLHKGSMLAFRARRTSGKTIRLNLAMTSTFNADFDGDEMNVHVPLSPMSLIELEVLSSVQSNFLSTQTGNPIPTFVQDAVVGMYLLSHDKDISRSSAMTFLIRCSFAKEERFPESMTGLECSAYLLPKTFCIQLDSFSICNRHISGYWTKKSLNSVCKYLAQYWSIPLAMDFVTNIQFLANAYLLYRGFSIGISDCLPPHDTREMRRAIQQSLFKTQIVSESSLHSYVKEQRMNNELTKTRDVAMRMGRESISKSNRFIACLESGSKGDYFNFMQVTSLLGQQNINGQRMAPQLSNSERALPHYRKDLSFTESVESRGFIQHSFLEGLSAKEYWCHAVSGREGVTNTAMKTANSGYAQRKMVKLMEDLQVRYDYTIRTASNHIVQFEYNHGFSTTMRPWEKPLLSPLLESCDDL